MTTQPPVIAIVLMALGAPLAVSCSTEDPVGGGCPTFSLPPACDNASDADDQISFVTPTVVHTGTNGRDLYQAVVVANFGDLAVSSSDSSIVCATRFSCPAPLEQDIVAVLTAQGSGAATVTITSGSLTERIAVNVASYSVADYDLGEDRYSSPANPNDTTRQACGDCHLGQGGAPHSPLALARYSDDELVFATRNSRFPGTCENDDGLLCDCTPVGEDCGSCAGSCRFNDGQTLSLQAFGGGAGDHVFDLTADEQVGIMAYMRAIEPEGL